MWVKIGGVLCPGLESLPWLRVAGTPRDQPSAVECPMMMPTDVCASWMTRVLFAGGYVGPRSPVAAAHGAIVHAIESMTDISDDGTVWRIKVAYGVARGTRLDRESQLAARLPDSFILKLYDDTPSNTARGHNESMLSRAPTPAHEPICFWSCLNPPGGAGVMPLVDPSTVSLLSWLRDEEWCAFDPEIKRRYAREARERRQAERERRQAEDEAREAERLRREEAGEESPEDEDEDEEEDDEDEDEDDDFEETEEDDEDADAASGDSDSLVIHERYEKKLRNVFGTRTDIRAYLKVLERQYIFRSGAVDQTHIDTIMANKDKCLRLTAPRMLTAAVLLEDIE